MLKLWWKNPLAGYNNVRLHSAIGYFSPVDKLKGWKREIFTELNRKLEEAQGLKRFDCPFPAEAG